MRVVMVTDDVRIDRRIIAESDSLALHGHEVIIVAGWEEGLPRHAWQESVKIERFRPENPGPVAEDYGFATGEPFWLAPPRPELPVGIRRSIGLMIRKSRALVIVTTAIRRSFRRLSSGIFAILVRGVQAAGNLRHAMAPARSSSASQPEDFASIDVLSPAERTLVARLRYLDPDLIHAHDLPLLRVGVHVKRALGIPLIYDSHELYTEIATLAPRDKAMLSAREQALLPECDRVITVNPLVAQEMVHRYGIPDPLVIQNVGSAPSGFRATDAHDRFRPEFAIGKSDYIFLYQGWLAAHR